jgi:hypothetical protein
MLIGHSRFLAAFFFLGICGLMPLLFKNSLSGSEQYPLSAAILRSFLSGRPRFPVFTAIISSSGTTRFLSSSDKSKRLSLYIHKQLQHLLLS